MVNIQELHEKISEQAFRMRKQMSTTAHHAGYIEQTKNILYNNLDAIVEALQFAASAQKQVELLELELSDAEREIDELTNKTTRKIKKPQAAKETDG